MTKAMKKSSLIFLIISSITLIVNAQTFNRTTKINASDRSSFNQYGNAVSVSGNQAIVGAYYDSKDSQGNSDMQSAGSAYIYERNTNGQWIETQKIHPSNQ